MIAWAGQRKRRLLAVAAIAVVVGALVARHRSALPEVEVAEATVGDLRLRIAASGLVEAESVDLSFKGQGKIANVYRGEAERASAGEVLARLDASAGALTGQAAPNDDVLLAPFEGTVVEVYRRAGAVVSPGLPVVRFVRDGRRWVTAFIDTDDAAHLRPGQHLQCRAGGYLSEAWDLEIVSVGREAVQRQDLPGSARQVRVRCEAASDRFPLVAGAEVDVDAEVPLVSNALLVPAAAVVHEGPRDWVWVIESGTVQRRDVSLGPNNFAQIQIHDGLAEGDTIVVHGKAGLTEGRQVTVKPVAEKDAETQGGE